MDDEVWPHLRSVLLGEVEDQPANLPVMGPSAPDDEGEVVVLRLTDLVQLLGRFGLPPWPDGRGGWLGGDVDCAPIAENMRRALQRIML
jgi:hypothetical protein